MKLNADLSQRVVIQSTALPWVPSPNAGVHRRMLARRGIENGLATSIVRYEPGASFTRHAHPQGEEFMVLDGEFEDEHGVYPAGTYVLNPPGSAHAPRSASGCVLFVKLCHVAADDLTRRVVRPSEQHWQQGLVNGLAVAPLHQFGTTHTALVRWAPGTRFSRHQHFGGEEILVLEGTFQDEYGSYPAGSWIRSPHMSSHQPYSEPGCVILVKVGHLLN